MHLGLLGAFIVGVAYFLYAIIAEVDIDPVAVVYPEISPAFGKLAINDRLSLAERLFAGMIVGPESFAFVNGLHNGSIIKVQGDDAKEFVSLRHPGCDDTGTGCTRPLGLRYDSRAGRLLVADAYRGVLAVDINTAKVTQIFPFDKKIKVTLINALDVLPDGRLLVSEASQKHPLHELIEEILEARPTGRLLLIDSATKTWKVLLDGIHFANGVQLHRDGKSVLLSETLMTRVLKVNINTGQVEVFASGLPGFTDNIVASPTGGYWVALVNPKFPGSFIMLDALASWPQIRYWLYKILGPKLLTILSRKKHGIIIRLDENGQLLETLHDTSGHIYGVTEAAEHEGYIYLGSFYADFIGRLTL